MGRMRSCDEHNDAIVVYDEYGDKGTLRRTRGCPLCDAELNFRDLERNYEDAVAARDAAIHDLADARGTISALERGLTQIERTLEAATARTATAAADAAANDGGRHDD